MTQMSRDQDSILKIAIFNSFISSSSPFPPGTQFLTLASLSGAELPGPEFHLYPGIRPMLVSNVSL